MIEVSKEDAVAKLPTLKDIATLKEDISKIEPERIERENSALDVLPKRIILKKVSNKWKKVEAKEKFCTMLKESKHTNQAEN